MRWEKKGLIFNPSERSEWMHAYAQVPTVLEFEDRLRIFFTCRPRPGVDGKYVSYISFIDVEKENPAKILSIQQKPSLSLGGKGSFDEFGTHPCCFVEKDEQIYFYYQGWMREVSVPYSTSVGLAISEDQGRSFRKFSEGPLFSRNYQDPYLENGFFVFKQGNDWRMFYASCKQWKESEGRLEPVYKITMANSNNGIDWQRQGKELFPPKFAFEASGRPCVIKIGEKYHMWFCYRDVNSFRGNVNGSYRIGYANSSDLETWTRDDGLSGIDVSADGWDSEMIAYPFVCKVGNRYLMFYNGNEFGKFGFGYAELKL